MTSKHIFITALFFLTPKALATTVSASAGCSTLLDAAEIAEWQNVSARITSLTEASGIHPVLGGLKAFVNFSTTQAADAFYDVLGSSVSVGHTAPMLEIVNPESFSANDHRKDQVAQIIQSAVKLGVYPRELSTDGHMIVSRAFAD